MKKIEMLEKDYFFERAEMELTKGLKRMARDLTGYFNPDIKTKSQKLDYKEREFDNKLTMLLYQLKEYVLGKGEESPGYYNLLIIYIENLILENKFLGSNVNVSVNKEDWRNETYHGFIIYLAKLRYKLQSKNGEFSAKELSYLAGCSPQTIVNNINDKYLLAEKYNNQWTIPAQEAMSYLKETDYPYYKDIDFMKNVYDNLEIIEVLKLNHNGVRVDDPHKGTMGEIKYFNDNGGEPSGNYNIYNIEGVWIHVKGKITVGNYAYRQVDDSTLIRASFLDSYNDTVGIYLKLIEELKDNRILLDNEWLKEYDKELLDWVYNNKDWGIEYGFTPNKSEIMVEVKFNEYEIEYHANIKADKEKWPSEENKLVGKEPWMPFDSAEEISLFYKKLKEDKKRGK